MTTVPWLSNDDVWRKRPAPLEGKSEQLRAQHFEAAGERDGAAQPRHGGGEVDRAGPGERGVE